MSCYHGLSQENNKKNMQWQREGKKTSQFSLSIASNIMYEGQIATNNMGDFEIYDNTKTIKKKMGMRVCTELIWHRIRTVADS